MTKETNLADLHEWLLESDAGDTKEFVAGKEQRKTLHKHCNHLVKTNRDLILSHEAGKRTLSIRIESKPSAPLLLPVLGNKVTNQESLRPGSGAEGTVLTKMIKPTQPIIH